MEIPKRKIERAFSRSARDYDKYSNLQREIARILAEQIRFEELKGLKRILDVGAGTGFFTHIISQDFPDASVSGCDISFEMLLWGSRTWNRWALRKRPLVFSASDAEGLSFRQASFQLVASNCAYQWSHDLRLAFREAFRVLVPDGRFCFSIFGNRTLWELRKSIDLVIRKLDRVHKKAISVRPASEEFVDREKLISCLIGAGFRNIEVKEYRHTDWYLDLKGLLKTLKNMGAGLSKSAGLEGLGWRSFLTLVEDVYRMRFGKDQMLPATYEVFFAKAQKPE